MVDKTIPGEVLLSVESFHPYELQVSIYHIQGHGFLPLFTNQSIF